MMNKYPMGTNYTMHMVACSVAAHILFQIKLQLGFHNEEDWDCFMSQRDFDEKGLGINTHDNNL